MNEVEVYYLQRAHYKARKHQRYKTPDEAMDIFKKTMQKFINERIEAVITLRAHERGVWRTLKSERS